MAWLRKKSLLLASSQCPFPSFTLKCICYLVAILVLNLTSEFLHKNSLYKVSLIRKYAKLQYNERNYVVVVEESDLQRRREGGRERWLHPYNLVDKLGTSVALSVKWQDRPGLPVYTSNAVLFSCAFLAY